MGCIVVGDRVVGEWDVGSTVLGVRVTGLLDVG